ncbi:uncharacterized protein [Argopecten irradians]|uniref:uncharacterized protein n=1 Tax=Argopecten irradians TaxID=31199 RepID=UPI0037122C50
MKIGKVVSTIKLVEVTCQEAINSIRADVHKHKLLIFKNQGVISGDKHVEISKWFGDMESTFYKHPKSPHPDVFRVSNDESEGCTRVGNTGMTEGFIVDKGTEKEQYTSDMETIGILKDIHKEIVKDDRRLIYSHKWEEGDFIISDNLAVGHEATPETQYPVSDVGLRILHRTTVKGTTFPSKS